MASIDIDKIVAGLGGVNNISEIEGCITRLRTVVEDASAVDEATLRAGGAMGVIAAGDAVQVVVGPQAEMIAEDIEDML
ncbi:glucose PTS transporter subunit EIIB [Corynebacterium uberis]|uniref:glucose PTS transporter subunit EIIB n=1 Tax=Corynebacterium TaxID=1716 RepID=UPI001D0AFEFB|nr:MULTISPECIES: glucose PTS transporter subunit EIIB [Corynebacterium]MCZ9308807.1 glucose PTS transporter subunit EIIB [Corynebacterium sp. c6VSa_13]UDL72665.1 glucose PTS transporter subunit EIIB [Corynebacterium uberis]UDL76459.1 glucose PTS transporter subunit EIIB [Corynebacterium uberis]UDL78671.1 glucose PTS transporter subunit EIIB [Corynebacterium uberis]UDL80950.1 glucose PTS transporter subunit EIIB [Corynebacterium uberis]